MIGGFAAGKHLQQFLQRVIALAPTVVDQVLHDLHFLGRDGVQRLDFGHMHDRAGHAGLHGMVQEHAVQHMPCRRIQTEGDIGKTEHNLNIREFLPDHPDALQRPLPQLAIILIAGGDGEGQRVNHQVALRQAMLGAGKIHQAAGDAQLVLGRLGHADLVDGQRNDRRAEFLRQLHAVFRSLFTLLEIDRVDDRLAAMQFQGGLDDRRLGRIDHQRRVHTARKPRDHLAHLEHLIAPHEGGADVERVRRLSHLLPANGDAAIPILLLLPLAPSLGAIGIAALADREVAILLPQAHRAIE